MASGGCTGQCRLKYIRENAKEAGESSLNLAVFKLYSRKSSAKTVAGRTGSRANHFKTLTQPNHFI